MVSADHPGWSQSAIEDLAFHGAIGWFPWYTIVCLALTFFYCFFRLKGSDEHEHKNSPWVKDQQS